MTPKDMSAIMWFVWSVGVCIFAVALAAHWGAFDFNIHNDISTPNPTSNLSQDQYEDEVIELIDGSTLRIDVASKKHMACIWRLGIWC